MPDVRAIVAEQAEDDGLWFIAATAPEAYLQQELRRLHAAIEAPSPDAPGPDQARWAFLNPETGDWIEVKPGTVVLAASPDAPREGLDVIRRALAIGQVSYDGDGWYAKDAGLVSEDEDGCDVFAAAFRALASESHPTKERTDD